VTSRAAAIVAALALALVLAGCGLVEPDDDGPPITGDTPAVTGTHPPDGATGVFLDTAITTTLHLPNTNAGVDAASLTSESVRLYRSSDGAPVPGGALTSGGRDSIIFQPDHLLDPDTQYTFEVTEAVRDESGAAFAPFLMRFVTGDTTEGVPLDDVSFSKQQVYSGAPLATLVIGPDDRLYGVSLNGLVIRWDIGADGALTSESVFNGLQGRTLIGAAFDPLDPSVLWVSHNDPLWPTPATDFTGGIGRVLVNEANFAASSFQDYILGLPRSVKDHFTNSLSFGPDGMLYVSQGGNTAAGAADNVWGDRPERLLSAAILRVDPRRTSGLPIDVQTEPYGGRPGGYNPYASGAPVTIYATGLRNAYDFVWHTNGSIYAPTNGTNAGGRTPASPDGSVPELASIDVQPDFVYRVVEGGYYGHPNPKRGEYVLNGGNPTGAMVRGDEVLPRLVNGVQYVGYPVGTQPDPNYRGFEAKFCCNDSTNGVIEYRSETFGGALQGRVLLVRFAKGHDIVALTVTADGRLTTRHQLASGFNRPLNLVEDLRNGNLYVAELVDQGSSGGRIQLLRPQE
jgi:hypothetical protein